MVDVGIVPSPRHAEEAPSRGGAGDPKSKESAHEGPGPGQAGDRL
jgi:hypothetical protein